MTGRVAIATAHWRRLDKEGTDRCTLSRLDHGWMLVGQAIWHEAGQDTRLAYDLRCDPDLVSLSADVCGEVAGSQMALKLRRTPDGWWLNDTLQPDTADCPDLDLSFTPATNLLPLRRLVPEQGQSVELRAAWLKPDFGSIAPLEQTYTRIAPHRARYRSPGFETVLDIHGTGFVIGYPEHWDGWVDD